VESEPPLCISAKHVVIGANAHAALAEALHSARPDLAIRGNKYTDLTADDLEWGDTYIGFRRPPLASMGNIRWVHCTGAGVDSWLLPVELPRDILLTRTSESFGPMIAEWALARALAFSQQLIDLAQHQRRREWKPRDVAMLRGTTVVVVGTGDVGTHVGRVFRSMGCDVHGVSRSGSGDGSVFSTRSKVSSLATVVSKADWLIVTLPLTSATRGVIGRATLQACRGAVLMNAGRGAVVDEALLPEALDNGWLQGAALDVFETEPLAKESPLWADARVIISPHISGITTTEGAVTGFLDSLSALERGETPKWIVDRDRQY
jgi:phosphoglycerate dehydrogenase-like enzyme